jgi:hypothetical protein
MHYQFDRILLFAKSGCYIAQRCYDWGTHLNNVMILRGGRHCLVGTHFTIRYSMSWYQREQNLQPITPREASLPPIKITNHHHDKTRRCVIGKPCPLGRCLYAVGRCRGEASPSTSSLHKARCHRQAKASLSILPRIQPWHHPPHCRGGPREQ